MKTCKKLLALLLALSMIFAFAACDKDSDNKKEEPEVTIYGTWTVDMDLSEFINSMLSLALEDFPACETKLPFAISFEFKESGEYAMTMSLKEEDWNTYMSALCTTMVDYMIDLAEDEGMSKEEFEAAIKDEYGMTLEEYAADTMEQATAGTVENFNQTTAEGYFKLVDNTMYMDEEKENLENVDDAEEYMIITLTATELTVTELGGDNAETAVEMFEMMGLDLPWKFKKQ